MHLLDATEQGLKPAYTIADAAQGLRTGQKAAWGDTPCHGDVFHIQRQCEGLANTLARLAKGATSRRRALQAKIDRGQRGPDDELASELALARQSETKAFWLTRDIRTISQWLSHDILALAGPTLATRQALFDCVVEELLYREVDDARRSAHCGLRCRTNATTCSLSPVRLMRHWPPSRKSMPSPSRWCGKPVCCTGCPAPRRPIGSAGTSFARRRGASSTGCSSP